MAQFVPFLALFTIATCESWEPNFFDLATVNYGHLISTQPRIREQEELKMVHAMQELGFMVLTNHGIPRQIMDAVWNQTRAFFDSSTQNKESVQMTQSYIYGYSANEMLAKSEQIEYFQNASDSEHTSE